MEKLLKFTVTNIPFHCLRCYSILVSPLLTELRVENQTATGRDRSRDSWILSPTRYALSQQGYAGWLLEKGHLNADQRHARSANARC